MREKQRNLQRSLLYIGILLFCLLPVMGLKAHALSLVDTSIATIRLSSSGKTADIQLTHSTDASKVEILSINCGAYAAKDVVHAENCKMFLPGYGYFIRLKYTAKNRLYYYADTTNLMLQVYIDNAVTPVNAVLRHRSGNGLTQEATFHIKLPDNGFKLQLTSIHANGRATKNVGLNLESMGAYQLPDESGFASWQRFSALPYRAFKGWSLAQSDNESDILFKGGQKINWYKLMELTDTPQLYAVWTPIPVTVALFANDGSGNSRAVSTTAQASYKPDSTAFPVSSGKILKGWSTSATGSAQSTIELTGSKSTISLYAIWNYAVSFQANGGSGTMTNVVMAPGKFSLPACSFTAPTGKKFKGWSNQPSGSLITGSIDVNGPMTLYAVWENIPTPETEKPAPETEKPQPATEKPAPETEKPQPATEKPVPETEKPQPATEKPAPETEKPTPETEAPVSNIITDVGSGAQYKITNAAKKTVSYLKPTAKKATVVIPDAIASNGVTYTVTSVAANAFRKNKTIKRVVLGDNITVIGEKAFSTCPKLASVTIGKKVTTIGKYAFYKCTALTKITIPSKVKTIGASAFAGDKKLKTITISTSNLTSKTVGKKAFSGIYSKAKIKVPSKKLSAYKTLLKSKGVSKSAVIQK